MYPNILKIGEKTKEKEKRKKGPDWGEETSIPARKTTPN